VQTGNGTAFSILPRNINQGEAAPRKSRVKDVAEIEITGIRKDHGNHENPFEAVEAYRWVEPSTGKSDITARQIVVDWIDNGINGVRVTAFVHRVNPRAECFVNQSSRGTRFLQTRSDATESNNLLKLPEC